MYVRDRVGLRIGRDPATNERRYVDDDEDTEKPSANALFESSRFVSTAYADSVRQPESHKELKTRVYIKHGSQKKKGRQKLEIKETKKAEPGLQ